MNFAVLIINKTDFKRRNFFDWLFSHISGSFPPHRYRGTMEITNDSLNFNGADTFLKTESEFTIYKNNIIQVYHGYDDVFSVFQTRGLGLVWAPVRLKLTDGEFLYIIAGYDIMGTKNKEFYDFLTEWFS